MAGKVVIAGLEIDRNSFANGSCASRLYMGFGYNPDLFFKGERLDMLQFFAWMKRIQDDFGSAWIIFDASGYAIVNRTPAKKIVSLGENPLACDLLEVLVEEQDRPKRKELILNCDIRSEYLQRLIALSGLRAEYVDSRQVFRESPIYEELLNASLNFVKKLEVDNPALVARLTPENPNPASRMYFPLEITEAAYLRARAGVGGKFGPTTEIDFDRAILSLFEEVKFPYQTIRCDPSCRRPGYLSDDAVIWSRLPDSVDQFLSDGLYRQFVSGYLQPFIQAEESLVDCARRMCSLLEQKK